MSRGEPEKNLRCSLGTTLKEVKARLYGKVCYARAWELENNGWMSYLPDKKKKEGNFL